MCFVSVTEWLVLSSGRFGIASQSLSMHACGFPQFLLISGFSHFVKNRHACMFVHFMHIRIIFLLLLITFYFSLLFVLRLSVVVVSCNNNNNWYKCEVIETELTKYWK